MVPLLFLLLHVLVLFRVSSASGSYYGSLQYRREVSVPYVAVPPHTAESLVLNTYALAFSASPPKLLPDCSDLLFLRNYSAGTQISHLPFWFETACPSTDQAHPYTTIWVDVPAGHDESAGDALWVLYGTTDSDLVPRPRGNLSWSGREVRLFADAESCSAGWTSGLSPAWADKYVTGTSLVTQATGAVMHSSDHMHRIIGDMLNCNLLQGAPMTGLEVCDDGSGSHYAMVEEHSHTGQLGDEVWAEMDQVGIPDTFFLRPCIWSGGDGVGGVRDSVVVTASGAWVAILKNKPAGGNWQGIYPNSEGRALAFGSLGTLGPAIGHMHGVPYPPQSWGLTDVGGYVVTAGADTVDANPHSHRLEFMELDPWDPPAISTDYAWFYYRSGAFDIDFGSHDWPEETKGVVEIFLDEFPPLGYEKIPTNGNRLVTGYAQADTEESFANPTDYPRHTHTFNSMATMTDPAVPGTSDQTSIRLAGACGISWGTPLTPSNPHLHQCTGTTGVADPGMGDLPNHVNVIFAERYATPSRALGLGTETKYGTDTPGGPGPGPGPGDIDPLTYAYIGAGVGGAILIAVIVVFVISVVICCCCCVCNRKPSYVQTPQGPVKVAKVRPGTCGPAEVVLEQPLGGLGSQYKGTRATLKIQEELFMIDPKDIRLLRELGRGGGGATVYYARWSGREVAYKLFATPRSTLETDHEKFDEFEKEVSLASSLKHPNIITFYGCCLDERLGIVMEFAELGELGEYIRRRSFEENPVPLKKKMDIMLGVSHGMSYLHSKSILHRDLKPANVLLDSKERPKIMDFGISRLISKTGKMTSRIGTQTYMAPEITLGMDYGPKVDVFSFAILSFEMLTENWHPYTVEAELGALEFKVANDPTFRPDLKGSNIPPPMQTLIRSMWDHDPSNRPTFVEIRDRLEQFVVAKAATDWETAAKTQAVQEKVQVAPPVAALPLVPQVPPPSRTPPYVPPSPQHAPSRSLGDAPNVPTSPALITPAHHAPSYSTGSILSELADIVDPSLLEGVEDILGNQ